MDISLIMKACGVGMLVAVASQVLGKSGREDMASLVSLAGVILVLMMLVGEVGALLERVREVLRVKFRLGLFDNPFADADKVEKVAGAELHRDFMLDIQQQSLVLLKNENNTLPLDRTKLRKVLVAGPLADESNFMISRYGPNKLECTTIYEGIKNLGC